MAIVADWKLKELARIYAAADPSDPFLYGRTLLHLRKGLLDFDELTKDTMAILSAKEKARNARSKDLLK